MTVNRDQRHKLLATLLVCSSILPITGCTTGGWSLASLNPFSKSTDSIASAPPTTGKLAALRQSATGQVSSMGTATKSAFTKTKNGVAGMFGANKATTDENGNPIAVDDPTRLDTPASVGPDVFVAQGQLWETTGDFTKAMQSYTKALESEPKNAAALASVARLHLRQENYQAAAESFRRALEQNPNDAGLHNDYGLTQAKLGDLAGATQSINKSLTLAPGTSRYANNLANVKYDAGDSAGALAVLMQHNKPAVAHFNMAFLHYKAGKLIDAKTHLAEVVKYEPQAASDTAVSKAVARSKEMLATIEGPASRIAQAAPQAYAAAGQFVNAVQKPTQPVAQPSQQALAQPGAAVSMPTTQATAISPANAPWPGAVNAGASFAPVNTAPITTVPPTNMAPVAVPVRTSPAPTSTLPVQAVAPQAPANASSPTTPYSLPPGFFNQ